MTISFENNRLLLDFPNGLGHLEILDLTTFVSDRSKANLYFKGSNLVTQKNKADRVLVFSLPLNIDLFTLRNISRFKKSQIIK